ncbi:MAG: polymer-forming cytoskeletal protein [Deltaproteobacteria bacterium]|nr:polymer-forming cytoskeletal protein [Deltaproteobacteria bacterium]
MIGRRESGASDIKAFLGKGSEFEGKLTFNETVRIDGNFKGQVISTGTLIVGDTSVINAEIEVGTAVISGKVEGNITARERLELHPPAKVSGAIKTPKLIIIEGAIFDGSCQMSSIEEEKKEETKRPTLLSRVEAAG